MTGRRRRPALRLPDWTAVDHALADWARTVQLLSEYFAPVDWESPDTGFTGSWFERYDGGGDREEVAHRFTAVDMVAVSLLTVSIPARPAWTLIADPAGAFSRLLEAIPLSSRLEDVDRNFSDACPEAYELYAAVRQLPGLGLTKATKVLARKRPHLLPVQDDVTMKALGYPTVFWEPLRVKLRDGLADELTALARAAEIPDDISTLRVLDVTLWMRHS
jgi:hypothetical protein